MSEPRVTLLPISTKAADPQVGCYGRGRCCRNNPGWFGPGEVERAAESMGLAADEFVRRYLVVMTTYAKHLPGSPMIDCFAPVKVDAAGKPLTATGTRVPRAYQFMAGPCVFYENERCAIHAARPVECRHYFCEQPEELNLSRAALATMWWEAARAANEGDDE